MGNRAVVTVRGSKVGVYLHWNGGIESVTAFLKAAKQLEVRPPESDTGYFYARFTQIIANYFGGTTSVGVDLLKELDCDNGNNGVYVIGGDFEILSRTHVPEHSRGTLALDHDVNPILAEVLEANKAPFAKR